MRGSWIQRVKAACLRGLFRWSMYIAAMIGLVWIWWEIDADWINWGLEKNTDFLKWVRQFLENRGFPRRSGAKLQSAFEFFSVNRLLLGLEAGSALILIVLTLREILRLLARFLRRRSRRRR